jgi:NADPH:quinone reductase-like Zn-dependent oxidoreductase
MARRLGAARVAMSAAPTSAAAAKRVGVDLFVDYHTAALADTLREAGPYQAIIDSVGRVGQLDRVLPLAAPGAQVAIYGIDDVGKVTLNPTLAPGSFHFYPGAYDEEETHQLISDWTRRGLLPADAWYDVEKPYALAEVGRAFADLKARRGAKALLKLE